MQIELVKQRLLPVFFILPLLVTAIYLYLFATDAYESEAKFIVREEKEAKMPFLDVGLLTSGTSASMLDSLLVQELVESAGMLDHLEEKVSLRQHYSDKNIDSFSRLDEFATKEDFLNYYLDRVEIVIDQLSTVATIKVKSFTPEMSQQILVELLERGDKFVNEIGHDLARDQIVFIKSEVALAEEKLNRASEHLITLQNQNKLYSAEVEALSLSEIITALETELAMQRTEVKNLESFLTPEAAEVITAKARVNALESQIAAERKKQTGHESGNAASSGLNTVSIDFQRAKEEYTLAVTAYESALNALDNARVDASRKLKHLVIVSPPTLPEEAGYPRREYILATMFFVLLLLFGISRLTIATIEDHLE